ncbi:MAG: hypothetical protein HY063_08355 [Bacteroidetes bacterium]|nr:hypothetical protein [Bacteroidota bacterium]
MKKLLQIEKLKEPWASRGKELLEYFYERPVDFDSAGILTADSYISFLQKCPSRNGQLSDGTINLLSSFIGECFVRSSGNHHKWERNAGRECIFTDKLHYFCPADEVKKTFNNTSKMSLYQIFKNPIGEYTSLKRKVRENDFE